jgi:SAM-dependent methyltransferase
MILMYNGVCRRQGVVISNCVINLSPDEGAVFREVFRVLKPGGRLSISDILLEGELPNEIKHDPKAWAACIAGAEPPDVYLGRMKKAGLQVEWVN